MRAVADRAHIGRPPQRGETWRLEGTFARHPQFGDQLQVEKARPLKPDGRVIAHYLTHHPAFRGIGIGPAKVARLSKTFGDGLVRLAGSGGRRETEPGAGRANVPASSSSDGSENAKEASVMAFLDACGADVRLASRVLRYWPDRTVEKLRENPYRLLFLAGWPAVDRIASSLGMRWDDDRRLVAAVESVVYARLHPKKTRGSIATALQAGILELFGHRGIRRLQRRAIKLATAEGTIVGDESDGYQAFGCAVMEKFLSSRFQNCSSHPGARSRTSGARAPRSSKTTFFRLSKRMTSASIRNSTPR